MIADMNRNKTPVKRPRSAKLQSKNCCRARSLPRVRISSLSPAPLFWQFES